MPCSPALQVKEAATKADLDELQRRGPLQEKERETRGSRGLMVRESDS